MLNPSESISLNFWTTDNGDIFKISTFCNGRKEGEATFNLLDGKMTKQRVLIQLLITKRSLLVSDIINACYAAERKKLRREDVANQRKLLARVKSLVSDIRCKLEQNGITKDIISPLGPTIDHTDKVFLRVESCNNLARIIRKIVISIFYININHLPYITK
ncbi:MAG: hypothetical protein Q8O92_14015 [Candidatus Latescibacter sp.]|nr:hypothetical protein [Candidatus Latescibacter sp.]